MWCPKEPKTRSKQRPPSVIVGPFGRRLPPCFDRVIRCHFFTCFWIWNLTLCLNALSPSPPPQRTEMFAGARCHATIRRRGDECCSWDRERAQQRGTYNRSRVPCSKAIRVGFTDIHPTLYVVSPWWNRSDSVLFGPRRTGLALPWTRYRVGPHTYFCHPKCYKHDQNKQSD